MGYPSTVDTGQIQPWLIETGETSNAAAGTLVANTTYLYAFTLQSTATFTSMRYRATTASGNCDLGIYDPVSGNLLAHTGSVAVVSALNTVNLTSNLTIGPGRYYLAFWIDNATATIFRQSTTTENMTAVAISSSTNATNLASTITGFGGVSSPATIKVVMSALVSGGLS